jgi:hypothetical protein
LADKLQAVGGSPEDRRDAKKAALDTALGGWFRTSKNEPLNTHGMHWRTEQMPHRYKLLPEIVGLLRGNEVCVFAAGVGRFASAVGAQMTR